MEYKLAEEVAPRMRVLAVDTTTTRGSVALVEGGVLRGEVRLDTDEPHSVRLVPAVDFLLQRLRVAPRDVEAFAVTTGPGSFTGLRVGIGTVQGLALAAGRPCLGLSALDVLAERMKGAAPRLVAVMDAWRGEVFARQYDADARPLTDALALAPGDLAAQVPEGSAFLGDGALRHEPALRAACPAAVFPRRSLFLAGTLGLLAEPRLQRGEGGPAEALRPLYLREAEYRRSAPSA